MPLLFYFTFSSISIKDHPLSRYLEFFVFKYVLNYNFLIYWSTFKYCCTYIFYHVFCFRKTTLNKSPDEEGKIHKGSMKKKCLNKQTVFRSNFSAILSFMLNLLRVELTPFLDTVSNRYDNGTFKFYGQKCRHISPEHNSGPL